VSAGDYRHVLYLSRAGDDDTQVATAHFHQTYNARKFVDALFAGDDWSFDDHAADSARGSAEPGSTVVSTSGVVVSTLFHSDEMLEIMECEMTPEQAARRLSPEHLRRAAWFRAGPRLPRTLDDDRGHAERQARRVVRSSPRASRAGLVPASDVALALGTSPRDLRAALRRLGVPKPAAGWAWPPAEAEEIKRRIRGGE